MQTIRGQCGCRHRKWTDCRNSVDFSSVFFFYVRKPDRDKCIWCLSGRNIPYSRNNNNNKSNNRRKKLKLYCLVFCILSNTTGILDNKRITKNYLIEILVVQLRLSVAFILRLRVCVSLYFFFYCIRRQMTVWAVAATALTPAICRDQRRRRWWWWWQARRAR